MIQRVVFGQRVFRNDTLTGGGVTGSKTIYICGSRRFALISLGQMHIGRKRRKFDPHRHSDCNQNSRARPDARALRQPDAHRGHRHGQSLAGAARVGRVSKHRGLGLPFNCSRRARFSSWRYAITSCCCRFIQPASTTSRNCHVCRVMARFTVPTGTETAQTSRASPLASPS